MFFSQLVEVGDNVVRIKKRNKIWILNWSDIVGANKLEGYIFLRRNPGDRQESLRGLSFVRAK